MASEIRIGRVSRIDYKNGLIAVTYGDRDESVTDMLPYLSFNGEYHMPKVEQYVLVVHVSTGEELGIVLGSYWHDGDPPAASGKDVYRKEFSNTHGKAYAQHSGGAFTLKADSIRFKTSAGSISVAEIIAHIAGTG